MGAGHLHTRSRFLGRRPKVCERAGSLGASLGMTISPQNNSLLGETTVIPRALARTPSRVESAGPHPIGVSNSPSSACRYTTCIIKSACIGSR